MTMNIMPLPVQASPPKGGHLTPSAGAGETGLFAEVFSLESEAHCSGTPASLPEATLAADSAQPGDAQSAPAAQTLTQEPAALLAGAGFVAPYAPEQAAYESDPDAPQRQGGSTLPPGLTMAAESASQAAAKEPPPNSVQAQSVQAQATQGLAEQATISVREQAMAVEQAAVSEQGSKNATAAVSPQARAQAPDWLAQIEHGRRWSQATAEAATQPGGADGDDTSLSLLGATAASSKESVADSASANPLDKPQPGPDKLAPAVDATADAPEASALVFNREASLLAPTPERAAAVLDKPLTLQGSPEQNAKQLAEQAQVLVSQNLQEADIKLNPSELGAMRIQIRMEQGEVQVQFVASHPQARELLEQAIPRLREMLNQQGMQLQQGQQQAGQQQSGQQQAGQQQSGQPAHGGLLSQSGFDQSSQQQSPAERGDASHDEWRSYSASGDEVQGTTVDHRGRAAYGPDGARIDFFA